MRVGGGMGGFDAAALVDGNVHDDRALLHLAHHCFGDDLGSGSAGDEDSTDDQVGIADGALDVVAVGGNGVDASAKDVVEIAEAIQVEVDQGDLCSHAEGDLRGVGANDAATDDTDVAGWDARDAAQKDSAAPML